MPAIFKSPSNGSITTLVADCLVWAPHGPVKGYESSNVVVVNTFELCTPPDSGRDIRSILSQTRDAVDQFAALEAAASAATDNKPRYIVEHYLPQATGRAFGPLALDVFMCFTRRLAQLLEEAVEDEDSKSLMLTLPGATDEDHANVAVLLGGFLVVHENWTAKDVSEALGVTEANRKFITSWSRAEQPDSQRVMTVGACWEGIEIAHCCDWLPPFFLKSDAAMIEACDSYSSTISKYDCSWIIPGKLWVSSDPVTTAADPNPNTFCHIFPDAPERERSQQQIQEAEDVGVAKNVIKLEDLEPDQLQAFSQTQYGQRSSWSKGHRITPDRDRLFEALNLAENEMEGCGGRRSRPSWRLDALKLADQAEKEMEEATTTSSSGSTVTEQWGPHMLSSVAYVGSLVASKGDESDDPRPVSYEDPTSPASHASTGSTALSVRERSNLSSFSTHTVCKKYSASPLSNPSGASRKDSAPIPFTSFLLEKGVRLVIRANFLKETGMPTESYDRLRMVAQGLEHADIAWEDRNGGVPSKAHVAKLLDLLCSDNGDEWGQSGILVHCKGGFGRSVILASCIIIYQYDVPGRALLGWSRIVRPGAINTIQQEQFLVSLKGRADLCRFAGYKGVPALSPPGTAWKRVVSPTGSGSKSPTSTPKMVATGGGSKASSCTPGCSIQ